MPSKKQTRRTIIKNVLEALVIIAICGGLVFVCSNQITAIVNNISQTKSLSIQGQVRAIDISQLQNQIDAVNGNDAKITNALMHEDNIIPFTSALDALAKKASVQQSYSFGQPTPYTSQGDLNVYSVPFTISISGNINGFLNYLNDFENLPYFAYLSSLNISSSGGLGQASVMSLSATLYVEQ